MTVKILKPIYDTSKTYETGEIYDDKTMPSELLKWAVEKGYAVDVETIAKDETASGGLKNLADALAATRAENEMLKAEIAKLKAANEAKTTKAV